MNGARIDYRRPRSALATVDSGVPLTKRRRSANDFYCEPRSAIDALLDAEPFEGLVWDPAAGDSAIEATGGAVAFAWYVWEHGHEGPPTLGWLRKPA